MTCEDWLEHVSAAADGELRGAEDLALREHLAVCGACRSLEAQFSRMRRQLLVGDLVTIPDLEAEIVRERTDDLRASAGLRRRSLIVLAGVAASIALLIGIGGAGGVDHQRGGHQVAGPGPAEEIVRAESDRFSDPTLRVTAGTSVEWLNSSSNAHHVVRQVGGTTLEQDLGPGQSEVVTFEDPGVYDYYCSIHEGMTGRVLVDS